MNRVWPYEYDGAHGNKLIVVPAPISGQGGMHSEGAGICIPPGGTVVVTDLEPLVAALYAAAGKPGPAIPDRPEPWPPVQDHPLGERVDLIRQMFGAKVTVTGPGRIREEHAAGPFSTSGATYGPDAFRRVAARCAQIADEAESYIDPAEVEELAAAIAAERGGYERPHDLDRELARAALRWMREREAKP